MLTGCGGKNEFQEPPIALPVQESMPIESIPEQIEVNTIYERPKDIPEAEAQVFTIKLMEYVILPNKIGAKPGPIRIIAQNKGLIRHKVEIEGKVQGDQFREDWELPVGESIIIDLILDIGEYEIYDPIPGYAENGMNALLVVS